MTPALITHPACLEHDTGPYHPETSERLRAVLAHAVQEALADRGGRPGHRGQVHAKRLRRQRPGRRGDAGQQQRERYRRHHRGRQG